MSAAAAAREPALERRPPAWQWLACLAAFAALLVRSAWLCDDAYITLRTAENLVAGAGPRWNVAERVQAYTHPLWMLLLALGRALSGEAYRSSLALSFALSLAGFALLLGGARGRAGAWVAAAALLGSKAFVDYSTSGLEGPLAHALGAALVLASAAPSGARSAAALALCASGLWLTRPDLVPLFGPLAAAGILARRRHRAALAAGFLPAAAWSGFALLYYGFLLPNTAPAKLGSGLPRAWLAEQGLCYLLDSLRRDPLTLSAVLLALGAAAWKRERASLLLAAGIALQLGYVVWIGGDFMSGRFLAAPLFAAALILARSPWTARQAAALASVLVALALASPLSPLRAPAEYGAYLDGSLPHDHIDARGIADERAYWFHYTGLLSPARSDPGRPHVTRGHPFGERLKGEGAVVREVDGMGFTGYFAGPEPHLVDPMGLTDPLLARLPIWRDGAFLAPQKVPEGMTIPWRIAHFRRPIPAGYLETLASGENRLAAPELRECWEELASITRAPLLAPGRLRAILRAHLGSLRARIERYLEAP